MTLLTNDATMPYTGRDKYGLDSVVREGRSFLLVASYVCTGSNRR